MLVSTRLGNRKSGLGSGYARLGIVLVFLRGSNVRSGYVRNEMCKVRKRKVRNGRSRLEIESPG